MANCTLLNLDHFLSSRRGHHTVCRFKPDLSYLLLLISYFLFLMTNKWLEDHPLPPCGLHGVSTKNSILRSCLFNRYFSSASSLLPVTLFYRFFGHGRKVDFWYVYWKEWALGCEWIEEALSHSAVFLVAFDPFPLLYQRWRDFLLRIPATLYISFGSSDQFCLVYLRICDLFGCGHYGMAH